MPTQHPSQPPFAINAQYVKDLSFENPNPLKSFSQPNQKQPELNVNVDVGARKVADRSYEVALKISAEATRDKEKVFIVDLEYAGIFTINNVPDDQVAPLLLIEGPRFLFPFARNVIADTTREGGFPPLALAPIDFLTLYQAQQARGKTTAPPSTPVSSSSASGNSQSHKTPPEKGKSKAKIKKKKK